MDMDKSFFSQMSKLLVRAVYVFYSLFLALVVLALVFSFVLDYRARMSGLNIGDFQPFPTPNDPSVPLTTSVSIEYNEPISPTTVNSRTFVVQAMQSGQVLATYGVHGGKIVLTPTTPFRPGELVLVSATTGTLSAMSGMGPLTSTVWQFNAATQEGPGKFITSALNLGTNNTVKVEIGDVDGDGALDVVLGNSNTPGEVWRNEADPQTGFLGNFVLSQSLDTYDTFDIDLGDVDGDGDLDIFFGNHADPNIVWVNLGGLQGGKTGIFAAHQQLINSNPTNGVELGDLDGDGDLDAFTVSSDGLGNQVWLNNGGLQGGTIGEFFDSGQLLGDQDGRDVALGDVDNDGDLDAWTTVWNGQDRLWLNNGDATFFDSGQLLADGRNASVALGDVDNDGDLDAFVGNRLADSRDELWINQGGLQNGTLGDFFPSPSIFPQSVTRGVAMGDVEGDGDLDLLETGLLGENDIIWLNDGLGNFIITNTLILTNTADSYSIVGGDVNNDGDLDIIIGKNFNTGPNLIWLNNSAPQIADVSHPEVIEEGSMLTMTVTISSTDSPDELLLLTVDWGDETTSTLLFTAMNHTPVVKHFYSNNLPQEEPAIIQIVLQDADGGQDSTTSSVTIVNVPPSLTNLMLTDAVNESGTAILNGEMFDPGDDELVLSLNWGEGMQEVHEFPAGTTTFSFTHTYLDDNPTGTPSDPYTVSMILVDEDLDLGVGEAYLTVHNLEPNASAGPDQTTETGTAIQFNGQFVDPGPQDTHIYWWELGEGTVISDSLIITHTYMVAGKFTVTFHVLDDDTGLASDTLLVTVLEPKTTDFLLYYPIVINKP